MVYKVPVLAIAHKMSSIKADQLKVLSTKNDSEGAVAEFNLIATDDRKPLTPSFMNADCDLESVGYRIVEKAQADGSKVKFVQVGVKVFKPMTTWNSCDVSLLIDSDKNGVIDQELIGANLSQITSEKQTGFASLLINARKAKAIRKQYEALVEAAQNDSEKLAKLKDQENYEPAFIEQNELQVYNNSTVVILESTLDALQKNDRGEVFFKVVVSHNEQGSIENDDYLNGEEITYSFSADEQEQSFLDLGETLVLGAGAQQKVLTRIAIVTLAQHKSC